MRFCHSLLVALVALFAAGCYQPAPQVAEWPYYLEIEFLSYTWFPEGSYWIYEEENTPGLMDSVYVKGTDTQFVWAYLEGYYEDWSYEHELYTSSVVIQGMAVEQRRYPWVPYSLDAGVSLLSEVWVDSLGNEIQGHVFFQRTDGEMYWDSSLRSGPDTAFVNGVLYFPVVGVTFPSSSLTVSSSWARGIGVIRREMADGTVWGLRRYFINR